MMSLMAFALLAPAPRQGTIKKLDRLKRSVRVEDWVNVRRIRTIETGFLSNQVGTAREGDRMIATEPLVHRVYHASTSRPAPHPRNAVRFLGGVVAIFIYHCSVAQRGAYAPSLWFCRPLGCF